jgi:hypothetical protein
MAGFIVDGGGLNAGADGGSRAGGQPSHAGVSRFGAAVASARIRQWARMRTHYTAMRTAAIRYTAADDEGAGAVARTV